MNTILRQLLDGYEKGNHFFCTRGVDVVFLPTQNQAQNFFVDNGDSESDFHGIVLQEIANLAMDRQIWRTTDLVSGDILFGDPSPEITVGDLSIIAMATKRYATKEAPCEEETSGDGGEADTSTEGA